MRRATTLTLALVLSLSTAGCELVGDVLEFGFWALVILGLIVFGAAWGLFRVIARKGRRGGPADRRPPP